MQSMNSGKKIRFELASDKEKKPKLVRDSFTIPKDEYAAIEALKTRALTLGLAIKKSELLRAGLMALTGLSDAKLKAALVAVPTLKTGRPSAQTSVAQVPVEAEAPAPAVTPDASAPVAKAPAARKSRKPRTVVTTGETPVSHPD